MVRRVNYEYYRYRVRVVAAPVRSDRGLATCSVLGQLAAVRGSGSTGKCEPRSCVREMLAAAGWGTRRGWRTAYPDVEVEVLVCDAFHVEADGRYRRYDLSHLPKVSVNHVIC